MQMTREQFSLLLAGIDRTRVKQSPVKRQRKSDDPIGLLLGDSAIYGGFQHGAEPRSSSADVMRLGRMVLTLGAENADLNAEMGTR